MGMSGIKKKTVVEFVGGLKDLVIKVGGKIVYSGESAGKKKTDESEKEKLGKAQMVMVSQFASCVNNVPALKYIWGKSRFRKTDRAGRNMYTDEKKKSGKANAYNKIVSANRRGISIELRPCSNNVITPDDGQTLAKFKAIISREGITLKCDYPEEVYMFPYAKRKLTPVGIICPFDPIGKSKVKFEMISKWYDIEEFAPWDYKEFFFRFDATDLEIMSKYKNCIIYITFVEETGSGKKTKWYQFGSEEFSLEGYPDNEIVFREDKPVVRINERYYKQQL
jgi:hypothetical protein